jgi:serine/threonine protein kinase
MVSHRDLKPDNILITSEKQVKLIDLAFGIKQLNKNSKHFGFVGTLSYMAPEIILKKECLPMPTDMWSFGVIMVKLATGKTPFQGNLRSFKNSNFNLFSEGEKRNEEKNRKRAGGQKLLQKFTGDRP